MSKLHVTVLFGGTSAEREVSLMSGRKVMSALDPARYEAKGVDLASITGKQAADLASLLLSPAAPGETPGSAPAGSDGRPDVVFIALHGGTGENGTVQGMLDLLGVCYTGSGVLASALAMNKVMAKKIFEREGIPTPPWVAVHRSKADGQAALDQAGLPCVVKPACQGSTIGVTVVRDSSGLGPALETAFQYGAEALVEAFVPGVEITGPVVGNEAARVLPLVEIVPASGFYDYHAKYTPGATEEVVPARVSDSTAKRARELTLRAHHGLGCRGISRVDMIAAEDEVYVLEVNTVPGLTETSLVPRAAEAEGTSFPELVDCLIQLALEERPGGGPRRTP